MPFTLAHPLAILPLARNRYFHFPALFIGSMSPDFLYFLAGKPVGGSHQFLHSEWINLPLTVLVYWIYRFFIAKELTLYLPNCLNVNSAKPHYGNVFKASLIFLYSAWFGMITHLFWDNFTHYSGYFVELWQGLRTVYYIPIYKWLQYSGGIIGMSGIVIFWLISARKYPLISTKTTSQKCRYWLAVFITHLVIYAIWFVYFPIKLDEYSFLVIRQINSFLIGIIVWNLSLRIISSPKNRRTNSHHC